MNKFIIFYLIYRYINVLGYSSLKSYDENCKNLNYKIDAWKGSGTGEKSIFQFARKQF
jgi:hypothetical protein